MQAASLPRVLLLNVGFVPRVGGSFRALYEMARRLPASSVEVLTSHNPAEEDFDKQQPLRIIRSGIFSLLDEEGTIPEVGYHGPVRKLFVIRILIRLKIFTLVAMFLLLLRTLWAVSRSRYDFVIAGQAWVVGWPALCAAKLCRKEYGVFVYGEDVSMIQHGRRDIISWLFMRALAGAKWIVCISSPTAMITESLGVDRSKIHVIRPGVDANLFKKDRSKLRSELKLEDTPVVLTVGRLIDRKGFDLIIRALPEVRQRVPGTVYLIRGDGPDKENLVKLTRELNLEDCVIFLDEVPYQNLSEIYNACDVFAMPNRCDAATGEQEGFGMVFVEASACGKPVIGGRSGGAVDAVFDGRSGFLVSGTDTHELADRLVELLLDGERRSEMGESGRQFVEKHHSWDAHAAQVWQLVERTNFPTDLPGLPVNLGSR